VDRQRVNFSDENPTVPAISPEYSQHAVVPIINSLAETVPPLIPPRSQQRSGPGLRPSQDVSPQASNSLLSPPDGRGLGYQNNGSSDSLSKGYRSTAVITPRTANHAANSGTKSISSPATAKIPMTSLLVGSEGNILDQFKGSDYADVHPTKDSGNAGPRSAKHSVWSQINNGTQATYHELAHILRLMRPSFIKQSRLDVVDQLDEITLGIDHFAADLRALFQSNDSIFLANFKFTATEQRQVERAMYKLHSLALRSADIFKFVLVDQIPFPDDMIRKIYWFFLQVNWEMYFVNDNYSKAYPKLQRTSPDNTRTPASISSRDLAKGGSRGRITESSRPSAGNMTTKVKVIPTVTKPPAIAAGFMISPPSSPPNLMNLGSIPASNSHYLTSPTGVPDIFKTGDWLNAGPNGKMEYDFINIVKALAKMLDICVKTDNKGTCGLQILRNWYAMMTATSSTRPGLENLPRSFNKLADGADRCYELMTRLIDMMGVFENRSLLREHDEFWHVMRDAIVVSLPIFLYTYQLSLSEEGTGGLAHTCTQVVSTNSTTLISDVHNSFAFHYSMSEY
jgi:hypothetical protein